MQKESKTLHCRFCKTERVYEITTLIDPTVELNCYHNYPCENDLEDYHASKIYNSNHYQQILNLGIGKQHISISMLDLLTEKGKRKMLDYSRTSKQTIIQTYLKQETKENNPTKCLIQKYQCLNCKGESIYLGEDLIYPILPEGEDLPDGVPQHIVEDFKEARLVVNYSVRSACVILRICTEKILNWLIEERLTDAEINNPHISRETAINNLKNLKSLNRKIEKIKAYKIDGIREKDFTELNILKEYGNDNSHAIRTIEDSDTKEAFKDLSCFIIRIAKRIITLNEDDEIRENRKISCIKL